MFGIAHPGGMCLSCGSYSHLLCSMFCFVCSLLLCCALIESVRYILESTKNPALVLKSGQISLQNGSVNKCKNVNFCFYVYKALGEHSAIDYSRIQFITMKN